MPGESPASALTGLLVDVKPTLQKLSQAGSPLIAAPGQFHTGGRTLEDKRLVSS